jgi:hypothetical protein
MTASEAAHNPKFEIQDLYIERTLALPSFVLPVDAELPRVYVQTGLDRFSNVKRRRAFPLPPLAMGLN